MKVNKKIIIPLLTITVAGAAAYSGSKVFAATTQTNYPPMVERFAEHFGLKVDDVKTFFDEERQQRQQDMLSDYADFLEEAVNSGDLTENQKDLLISKKEEQQKEMANFQPGSENREDRFEKKQARRDELVQWAKDNNIDQKYLFFHSGERGEGGEGGRGFGMGRMMRE